MIMKGLMDLPRATAKNVSVINIPQNSLLAFFLILASHAVLVSFFLLYSLVY